MVFNLPSSSSLQKPVMELPFWCSFFMTLNSAGVALPAEHKTESLCSFVCLMFSGRCCSQHPKFSTTVQDWVMIQRNKVGWYLRHLRMLYRTVGGTVTKHVTLRAMLNFICVKAMARHSITSFWVSSPLTLWMSHKKRFNFNNNNKKWYRCLSFSLWWRC